MEPRWPEGTTCKAISGHWGLHSASYPTKGKVFLVTAQPRPRFCSKLPFLEIRRRKEEMLTPLHPDGDGAGWHQGGPEASGQGWGQRWVSRVALIIRHSQSFEKMVWTHSSQGSGLVTQKHLTQSSTPHRSQNANNANIHQLMNGETKGDIPLQWHTILSKNEWITHACYNSDEPWKTLCWVKEASHTGSRIAWFYLYEMSRSSKSIETESRSMIAKLPSGWGEWKWLVKIWVSFRTSENVLNSIMVIIVQACENSKNHWIVHFKWLNCVVCEL